MQDFRELDVWQRAHGLVLRVYQSSKKLPPTENFGLTLQLRRTAASIATRIAEGTGRPTDAEFAVELKRSRAAGYELEYTLLLCHDLGYLDDALYHALVTELIEVRKMTSGLLRRVNSSL